MMGRRIRLPPAVLASATLAVDTQQHSRLVVDDRLCRIPFCVSAWASTTDG
jgi:hypothetical protein